MRIISVFVFILVNIVFCQILPIKTYNVEDGLSQSQVQVVVQDSVGYLWFGTADGLSRFDGQKFVNYTVHDGLANNEITCAYVDGDSLIWFGHSLNGITLFHQKTGKFRPVVLDSLMLFHHLNQILKDPDGAYWFGLQDAGLFRYDGKKTIHVKLFEDVKNISVRAICMGQNQKLWVGTNKGVVIIDPVNFKDVKTFRTINKNTGLPDDNITCINRDHAGNMWLGTQAGGLIQVIPGDNENKRFRFTQFTTKNGLSNNWVWKVFVDKDGAIWAGTYRGVSKLRKNCRGRNCFETILKENGLRHNTIADIFQDREGNYWFGTWGGGVSRYIGRQFETFTMTQGLPDNSVWAIIEDGHGNLWVGTEGGIAIFRKTDREGGFKFFKQLTKANGKLPGNFVISFARDRRGYIWAGLLGFGLCRVNPSNYRVKWFDNSDGLASNNISSLLIDNRNNLWIATLDSGVTRFNLTNYTTTTFNEKNGLRSNRINSISQDSEGNIFFSTMDRGITVYRNDEFVTFNKKKGLEHARINVVTQDQSGNYWIGTAASGAYYVSDKKQKHFSAKTGLGGDNVFTIVCDTQGRVWLGTKNGLDRFDPRDSSFTHFGINDGFLVVEPNQNATYVDKSGHLWFGGIYGLARFNPDQIRTAPIPAKVILDKVQVFFKDLPDFKVHTFPYTKNHFTFHFKAFFYKNPNSISYTYRLKGFYSIWSPLTKQVETTYSNLPPGQYRFQVKAHTCKNKWSNIAEYAFVIEPAFWMRPSFYFVVLILVLGSIYEFIHLRTKAIQKRNQLLEERVKERTAQLEAGKKELERAYAYLQESENKFRALTETTSSAIFIYQGTDFVYVNKATAEVTGYSVQELLKMKFWDVVHPDFREKIRSYGLARQQGEDVPLRYEFKILTKQGKELWVDFTAGKIEYQGKQAALGTAIDITDRKMAEEALSESESRLRTLINAMPDIVCFKDGNGRWLEANQFLLKLLGIESKDYHGKTDLELSEFNPFYRDFFLSCIENDERAWSNGTISRDEQIIPQPDSSSKVFDIIKVPVFNEDGSRKALVVIGRDITEKKQTAQALLNEKEKLDVILRNLNEAVVALDRSGRIQFLNNAAQKMFGVEKSEALGQVLSQLVDCKTMNGKELTKEKIEKAVYQGKAFQTPKSIVLINRKKEKRSVEFSCIPLREGSEKLSGCVATFWDVTEKQHLEEELFKARKLESLGILAGGLAHDFNNILTAIIGNLSLIKLKMNEDCPPKLKELLVKAEEASFRAQGLTQQLLTFSRGGAPVRKTISLQELVMHTVEFALRGSNVKYKFDFPADFWPADVDEGQISQVVNNLVINAMHAMPEGGMLWVSGENIEVAENSNLPLKAGSYAKISFKDTGHGISEKIIHRIFDPYFSTKKKGSGLGLASTFSIVQKHEGHITVESAPGKGSTFTVFLPAAPGGQVENSRNQINLEAQKGRILVMDDEPELRELVKDILGNVGYRVDTCRDGQEAVIKYSEELQGENPYDLVILDLTVPGGMGGKKTIEKLLRINPNVVAIVSSGYSNDPIMAEYEKFGFKGVVSKPYSAEQLIAVTNELLRSKNR